MSEKRYLWIEDRNGKASHQFWTIFMNEICPDVIVESKINNRELVKAVKGLADTENKYIIALDNSFDNVQVYKEQKKLKEAVIEKNNVILLDIVCFEYTLLEFEQLIDWIYAPKDDFREQRVGAIRAREKLIQIIKSGEMDYKGIQEIMDYDNKLNKHNIEQLSAKLLFDLTRNTGFEVSKGKLGECWKQDCCNWTDRQADDICGLDQTMLNLKEKMRRIYMGTSLYKQFENIGLEVVI